MSDDQIGAEVALANAGTPAVVHPITGEVLDLDSPTDILAAALSRAKEQGAGLQAFTRAIKDELLHRMDYEHCYTVHAIGVGKVAGDGKRPPDHDGTRLLAALLPLVPDVLSMRAVEAAVERVTTYKPRKAGINALLKSTDERVIEAVRSAEMPNTKPRDVRVTPEP